MDSPFSRIVHDFALSPCRTPPIQHCKKKTTTFDLPGYRVVKSFGVVRGGRVPWEITLSTFPWREGKRLEFADQLVFDSATGKLKPNQFALGEQWTVAVNTLNPDDLKALFPAGGSRK